MSIAGESGSSAIVGVGPPCDASGPRRGSRTIRFDGASNPHDRTSRVPTFRRFRPKDPTHVGPRSERFPATTLSDMSTSRSVATAAARDAVLRATVAREIDVVAPLARRAPPTFATFRAIVDAVTVVTPDDPVQIAPPAPA